MNIRIMDLFLLNLEVPLNIELFNLINVRSGV